MDTEQRLHGVVLAGGAGTRFWPLSRRSHPKQLLDLNGEGSLLKVTLQRISSLIPPSVQWLVCGQGHLEGCRAEALEIPEHQVLAEPIGRNTAPAIGLAAVHLSRSEPDALIAVLPADQHVTDPDAFCEALARGAEAARGGSIVTLGISPTRPETGYGYVEQGVSLGNHPGVFKVKRFCEKPNPTVARSFLDQGNFLWNAGIFIVRCDVFLAEMKRQLPALYAGVQRIGDAVSTTSYGEVLRKEYTALDGVSVDYGIMEGAEDVVVVPVSCGWSDVGSFGGLGGILEEGSDRNLTSGDVITLDSTGCTVLAPKGHVVGVVGMTDVVVVHTGDATLVVPRERAQDVREIISELEKREWHEFL